MGSMNYSTRDAVEDIWGPRKGYKGTWPSRVDANYDEEPEKWVTSACVMCSNGCGLDIGVKDGKIVGVRGREIDRVNHGRLGPKGLYSWRSLSHPDRLKYPMIRKHGKLERATWDEAMSLIVERTKNIQERLTNHGIGFYTTGQLFLEEYYALAMVGKAGLNTLHMDGNTRLCTATAAASMRENFGSDGQPGSYTDIDHTSCIMLVGHNMSATQTVLWSRILDRLAGPDPPQIIVIDPRKSNSAKKATLHLAPRIGTNCALLNGIEHLLFKKGYINEEFVSKHVVNREKLANVVKEYPPDVVSKITGVPEADIERAADILGKTPSLLSTALQGVYQSNQATASACQINNINLLLGHIGKPGSGIFQMNGQPTAQNNREAGCDGEFPGFRNFLNPNHMQELADLWNIELTRLPHWNQPTHIENMMTYIDSGLIEMLWVNGTNPLVSLPNLPKVRETLTKQGLFLVVQDIFPNETTAIADVVLPAAAWGEKTGCFTNVDRTVHISHKAVEPPGEAKADMDIFIDFGERMDFKGKDGSPLFSFKTPEEAFKAWQGVSKGRPCDYSGMSYEKLSQGTGIQWPCNEEHPNGTERLFSDGKFFTDTEYCEDFGHDLETGAPVTKAQYEAVNPGGRAILKECHYLPETEATNDEYPLQLSTGRRTRHFHTRTKTGRTKELQDADPDNYIQISEHDAKHLDIQEGDMVLAESRRGKIEVVARVGDIQVGQVFTPMHYGYFDTHDGRARAANELTQERWDPVSKQPMFKSGAVRVTKIPPGEVKIHAPEQQTPTVKNLEQQSSKFDDPGDVHGDEKLERMLEYWLGATFTSFDTLQDICDHIIPRVKGVDFEIGAGMSVMHRITTACIDKLKPITEKYEINEQLGHDVSTGLKDRLFPEAIMDLSGSPAYDVLIVLQSFYLFLGHIEAHLFALQPTSQAAWDKDFNECIKFLTEQNEKMQAWTKQQLHSRGPQTLLVPCKQAVGLRERIEKRQRRDQEGQNMP
ncbi:hypothetical protein PMZ80_009510 [Knufia obscura]|uniref:4Fe-4S Mo/W bis-MGD-type domain-containing protein n=1 Tax=Knufia obscura TaxID=1635080 RepID=A0ABR0REB6_9EURO|nr:hypothetical protein PMZ80_009510 [Knufia obscura]